MKLILSLIFDCIKDDYDATIVSSTSLNTIVARPIIFQNGIDPGKNICVIINSSSLPLVLPIGTYISLDSNVAKHITNKSSFICIKNECDISNVFNSLQRYFDLFDEWESKMTEIADHDKGFKEIVQVSSDLLRSTFTVVDINFNYIAYPDFLENSDLILNNQVDPDSITDHLSNPLYEHVMYEEDVFDYPFRDTLLFGYNFRSNDQFLGRVLLSNRNRFSNESNRYLVRILAKKIETMLIRYGSFVKDTEIILPLRDLVLSFLSNAPVNSTHVKNILAPHHWKTDDEYMLVRLQPEFRHEWNLHAPFFQTLIETKWQFTAVVEFKEYLVILINMNRMPVDCNIQKELAYLVREYLMLACISRTFNDITELASAYRHTEIAEHFGKVSTPTSWMLYFDDYALNYWIKYGANGFNAQQICSPAILALIEHDRQNNTEFYKTIKALFAAGHNYSAAADLLFIHRTTLISRVKRIVELTDIDLDDSDTRLYIELSIRHIDAESAENIK